MIKTLLIRLYFKGVSLYDSHFHLFHFIILRTLKKTCRFIFFSFFLFTCQSHCTLPVTHQGE